MCSKVEDSKRSLKKKKKEKIKETEGRQLVPKKMKDNRRGESLRNNFYATGFFSFFFGILIPLKIRFYDFLLRFDFSDRVLSRSVSLRITQGRSKLRLLTRIVIFFSSTYLQRHC